MAVRQAASAAYNTISGELALNATWYQDIFFTDTSGDPYDISDLDFELTLRACGDQDSADLTLSIGDGLTIIEDSESGVDCILRIDAGEPTSLTAGDYIADLSMRDDDDVITLLGHGVVTVANNPVSWS